MLLRLSFTCSTPLTPHKANSNNTDGNAYCQTDTDNHNDSVKLNENNLILN